MGTDGKSEKFACCLGCLASDNDSALYEYKIGNGTLKSIIQMNEICLCYICKHLAQKTELFIQNVQSNQILIENLRNNITTSILESAKTQSQVLYLATTTLDPVEVGSGKSKDVTIKVEVKDENGLSNQTGGEFVDDDNDFQESPVKEEEDDFPLKNLLKGEFGVDRLAIKLKLPLKRRKAEKKVGRRKKHSKSKNGIENEYSKEEYPLNDLLKDGLVSKDLVIEKLDKSKIRKIKDCNTKKGNGIENEYSKEEYPLNDLLKEGLVGKELVIEKLDKSKIRKTKDCNTKTDLFKTKMVYITREQCMEERVKMAEDKKYVNCTYKCADCVKGFYFRESYEKHMQNHSETMGDYQCDICKQRMDSKVKLLRHKKCHEVRYQCLDCGLTRINRLTIREHYNAFHLKLLAYPCPHCPKAFKRQVSLRKHVAYLHRGRARVKCQHCQKTYANKEVLKSHMIVRHPQEVSAGAEGGAGGAVKRCVCAECGAAFKAPSQLRNHSIKHSLARDHYCVECDKSFKSEAAFKRHVKIAAPHVNYLELPLPCTRCDKRFAVRRDLERHMNRVHLNIRPFQCDKCDRAYVNNWSLNEHKRFVHDGHKRPLKYPCSMCDKVFDRNQTLKAHVRTHTGERPFPCARCAARFAQSSALGTHIRLVHLRLARDGTPRTRP